MPYIILNLTDDVWLFRVEILQLIDGQLSSVVGFDTNLCKYRLVHVQEFVIASTKVRSLVETSSIRCDFITFNDRPKEVLDDILRAFRSGLESLTCTLDAPLHFSVTIITVERNHHISGKLIWAGGDL